MTVQPVRVNPASLTALRERLYVRRSAARQGQRFSPRPMTDMQPAQDRLRRAVERIEHAVARPEVSTATTAAARGELLALQAERDQLGRALAQAKSDNVALRAVADQVAARLDRAIDQLRLLLGR